jgi:hypothetical protein
MPTDDPAPAYHRAYTRPRFTDESWHRTPGGQWGFSDPVETGQWEVVCSDCGDDGGPHGEQTEKVQRVRGPYPTQGEAERASTQHTGT